MKNCSLFSGMRKCKKKYSITCVQSSLKSHPLWVILYKYVSLGTYLCLPHTSIVFNQTQNISVVLTKSLIKIRDISVKGFLWVLTYDWTYKHPNRDYYCIYIYRYIYIYNWCILYINKCICKYVLGKFIGLQ